MMTGQVLRHVRIALTQFHCAPVLVKGDGFESSSAAPQSLSCETHVAHVCGPVSHEGFVNVKFCTGQLQEKARPLSERRGRCPKYGSTVSLTCLWGWAPAGALMAEVRLECGLCL